MIMVGPNLERTIDDIIMDTYLDEGESYEDSEIYARRAMNKLKHSAEGEELDDEDYWEPYLEALEDYWYACVRNVNRAADSYRNMVEFIGFWQEVSEQSSHSLTYVLDKLWKFKYDAYRMVWNQEAERLLDFVIADLEPGQYELLENFNPEDRDYEGEAVYSSVWGGYGPPDLREVKEVFDPYWLSREEGKPYAFDLFRSEENKYTPRSGGRITRGRKQRWIPVAVEYLKRYPNATAAEILPNLPDTKFTGRPANTKALSNRLIRMPDIFITDKSRKPYRFSLATKQMDAEMEQLSDAVVAVSDRYDETVGYVVVTDGDDEDMDFDNVGVAILDEDREPIAEVEIGQSYYGYDQDDEEYFYSEQFFSEDSEFSYTGSISGTFQRHIHDKPVNYDINYRCTHDIDSDYENDIEDYVKELIYDDGDASGYDYFDMTMGFYEGEIDVEGNVTWGGETMFEANFDPNQPRNSLGQWVKKDGYTNELHPIVNQDTTEPTMDLDIDELSALADAIRLQDETFPEVEMLLEQIGDTPENREMIFQEMLEVMTNLVNQVVSPEPERPETPEEFYQYILEEPADSEVDRIYRQASYYAQFKTDLEIQDYLEELSEQYMIANEMGAPRDVIEDIEKDINFVELVGRVQNMQREFQAPDWNPTSPRVPGGGGGGGCVNSKGEPVPCPNPGKGGGTNPMGPPMKPNENQDQLFVNKVDGSLWTGKNPPNEQWRPVTYIPITQNGQQRFIRNIMEDIAKMFPPSAIVYRSNPPLIVVTDLKYNIDMLSNNGFVVKGREITYE